MQSQWLIAGQRSKQFEIQDEPPEQKEEKEKEEEKKKSTEAKEKSKEKPSTDEKKKTGDEKKMGMAPMKINWDADMTAMGPAPSESVIDQSQQAINGFDLRSGPPLNVIVAPLVFEMDPAGQRESFVLQNNETKEIAFKVKTNDNKRLRIHPVCDYVPPGKTKKILVTLLPGRNTFLRIDVVLAPYKFGAASAKDNVDSTARAEQSRVSIRLFAMKIEDVPVEKKGEKEKEQGKENSSKKHSRKKKKGDQSSKKHSKSRQKKKSGLEKKEQERGDNSDKHRSHFKKKREKEKEQGSKDNSSRDHSRKRNKAEKNEESKKHHSQPKSRKKREKKEKEQPSTDNDKKQ